MVDVEPYVAWSVGSTPVLAKTVMGEDAVVRCVDADVRRTVRERTDPAWTAAYREACPVPGVGAEAYGLRELRLDRDRSVLAGIHFYGGDVGRPFVGIYAQTSDLSADAMRAATPALCDAFAPFGPQATWWWVLGGADAPAPAAGVVPDQRLLIGALAELVRTPVALGSVPFSLRRDERGDSYADYDRLFSAFLAAHPKWTGRLSRSDPEDYAACARAGGLFEVVHRGRMAGVIAARLGEVRGLPGWLIEEVLLGEELRGRGFAPLVQRMALALLDARERPLVLGTIDADNAPSWRTARRVGRVDVGGWIFVPDPRR